MGSGRFCGACRLFIRVRWVGRDDVVCVGPDVGCEAAGVVLPDGVRVSLEMRPSEGSFCEGLASAGCDSGATAKFATSALARDCCGGTVVIGIATLCAAGIGSKSSAKRSSSVRPPNWSSIVEEFQPWWRERGWCARANIVAERVREKRSRKQKEKDRKKNLMAQKNEEHERSKKRDRLLLSRATRWIWSRSLLVATSHRGVKCTHIQYL